MIAKNHVLLCEHDLQFTLNITQNEMLKMEEQRTILEKACERKLCCTPS